MRRLLNLRYGLPAAIFLVFLALSVLSYYYNLRAGEKNSLDIAVSNALSLSERLARTAQIDLIGDKAQVDSDLGVESADWHVSVLAVADEDGKIQAAHRLEWIGKNMAQTVRGFDLVRLKGITQGRLPDVQVIDGASRYLQVLTPFIAAGTQSQIRSLASGVVYLEYDLSFDDARNRWLAQRRWLIEAVLGMLMASLLSLVLYRRVARHLLRIEAASRLLSDNPDASASVPVAGPLELRQLALAFNTMADKVVGARRDMASESAKLAAIVGSAMDAIITFDAHQRVTMINEAALELFGYTREQAIGLNLDSFVPQRFRHVHAQNVKRFGQQGDLHRSMGQRAVFAALRANGEEFPIRASISHLLVAGDELYTVILQDVSKEIKAETEIRQLTVNLEKLVELRTAKLNEATQSLEARQLELAAARDELQNIFDSATVGILLSRDRVILRCNPKAASMLGYAPEDLNGQMSRILYPSDDVFQQSGQILRSQLREAGLSTLETRMARRDGSVMWVRMNARLLNDGSMNGMLLAFLEDVSLQHATSEALRQAKEKAEEASAAKANFLANMSHEIRTPMNSIIGMSQLALGTSLDTRQRNYIEKVHRSGENLLGIINDILDFSKIEAGKLNMEVTDFNLDGVMDNLANLLGFKTEDKDLELLFDTAPDVPLHLIGDPLRLGQVLINLGNNAVKFTERGEIVVGIEKLRDHADGVELHFLVRDTGIGMTPEQCDKLFQSFSQADASTTRKYGGTGLGLAICKSLVEGMRGKIWVESVPNQGSTFHFQARFGVQANPQVQRMFRAEELLGVRLLVVDDNASAREILTTMAQSFGLVVDTVSGGPEALQRVASADLNEQPYDLVLMDWKMPGMDGFEAMRNLRAAGSSRTPTVIMITSFGRDDAAARAQNLGVSVQTVLTKPVTPSGLLEAIGEALGKGTKVSVLKEARLEDHAISTDKLRGSRVLLVEDNDMNQELAQELLTNAGIEVVLARHGQEALDILDADPHFDGVLMDCQMPVMDGYKATQEIRKNLAFHNLPIIAMTANAMAGDKEKVLEVGMWDHIAKPLNLGDMFATMAKWISPSADRGAPGNSVPLAPAQSAHSAVGGWLHDAVLPGIDTRFGLTIALNKEALYRRLLIKFRDGQAHFETLFAQARAGADRTAAHRCAHTLAGTASTVGAKRLQEAARRLEQACGQQAPQEQVDAILQEVLHELTPVMDGLKALGSGDTHGVAQVPAPAVETEQIAALRVRLLDLMDMGDSRAIDLCEEHQAQLQTVYPTRWKKIMASLHNMDFEAALELFKELG
ncbi:diguanylate cyclase [Rhodoferax lacus]|uniref:Sensory/regulatory protein RpfC n=1 Tax=Rhodoferax lacus TaxID=2184758 RepID=A0A3E1RB90_9BURK|nr:response regulator [Rhodoferax lacus]RFO96619.1 diguanylate cyclase [Rhodoferax lacus]